MIQHFGFYFLRRPLNPLDHLTHFHQQTSSVSFEDLLRIAYQSPLMQDSINITSLSLYKQLQCWLRGDAINKKDELLVTLYKYLIRSSTRCTPYGLFACCAVGEISLTSKIELDLTDKLFIHAEPDILWLTSISDWLTSLPVVRKQVNLFPNPSIYSFGNDYRYTESSGKDETLTTYVSTVTRDHPLSLVLKKAKQGVTIQQLCQLLAENNFEPKAIRKYVDMLIENKLLEFDLKSRVTGAKYLDFLVHRLQIIKGAQKIHRYLVRVQKALSNRELQVSSLRSLLAQSQEYGHIYSDGPNLLKVDTFFLPKQNNLSEFFLKKIQSLICKLMALNQSKISPHLEKFKKDFLKKFEHEEVPLTLALDGEIGLGFGNTSSESSCPMIDDLNLASNNGNKLPQEDWWEQYIIEKYAGSLMNSGKEIILTDEDLNYVARQRQTKYRTASSFYVFGNILANSFEDLDNDNFLFHLKSCKGPSAVNMLSRFAQGSPELNQNLRKCTLAEEQLHPDVIFAEIVHCPENNAGNIMARPNLHSYEIPYLGQSSVSPEFQIHLSDLMISVRNGEIILRSQRLNKRIVPRLSNAHNYSNGLPVYAFFGELQNQDANLNIYWNWGILRKQTYLPRVRYKNILLDRQTWIVRCKDLEDLSNQSLLKRIKELQLPQLVNIVSGDNELLIDLNVEESLKILLETIKKKDSVVLKEFLSTPDNCLISKGSNRFTNEFVIPFINTSVSPMPGFSIVETSQVTRQFPIGSEWLYFKIYMGATSTDNMLTNILLPLIKELLDKKIVKLFFYIRYNDPHSHIRLRFYGNPDENFYNIVLEQIIKILYPFLESKLIFNIETTTYQREIERYGSNKIELCESFFHYDSLKTLYFLNSSEENCDENERFLFAIERTHFLIRQTQLSLIESHTFISKLKEKFFEEFNGTVSLRKNLNRKYQYKKTAIEKALNEVEPDSNSPESILLKAIIKGSQNKEEIQYITSSLIHMTINRIFHSKQRIYELVLYHCLSKHYDSILARQRLIE